MNSHAHAVISLVVAGLVFAVTTPPVPLWVVVAVTVGAGVGVDFDHFLLARHDGDWEALWRCLRDPRVVLFDQEAIFDAGEVGAVERLLSHAVIGGVAVPLVWLWSPYLAGLVATSLYAHVLADLVETVRTTVVLDSGDPRLN